MGSINKVVQKNLLYYFAKRLIALFGLEDAEVILWIKDKFSQLEGIASNRVS